MIRLQKYLARCGVASRRQSERLIADGRVRVNDRVAQLGDSVDPAADRVQLDGSPVYEASDLTYILLNKPAGVVTSAKDTHDRRTVIDCLNGLPVRVFPVGRLDMDVKGALLLTNDGELAFRLTHPRYRVDKVYLAWVEGCMAVETARKLQRGVVLEDGKTAPARVTVVSRREGATLVQLTLREGRKREVKRMCDAVGHRVQRLERISIGGMCVGNLQPGEWRRLLPEEVAALRTLVGLGRSD